MIKYADREISAFNISWIHALPEILNLNTSSLTLRLPISAFHLVHAAID